MVDPITISSLFSVGQSLIERIWPDPTKQAEELRKLHELEQKGDLAEMQMHVNLLLGQIEINKAEAQHKSIFVAGWRPMVGWTGAIALALAYIPKSLAITGMWIYQNIVVIQATASEDMADFRMIEFPDLGITEIIGLLGSMLGIGIMRSVDKFNGVDTKSTGRPVQKKTEKRLNWFKK